MRKLTKVVTAYVGKPEDLSANDRTLLENAVLARERAQAPYSKYSVGVAVKAENKRIYWGCNVERCTWTQTTHAEQNAIDSMVAMDGPSKVLAVGLVAAPAGVIAPPIDGSYYKKTISSLAQVPVPCGHCLQIIWENCFGDESVKLIALTQNGEVVVTTIGDALPMKFGPEDLGVDYGKK